MINHVYEIVCDHCGNADYVHGMQNKTELKAELIARGFIVKVGFKFVFCDESCERAYIA